MIYLLYHANCADGFAAACIALHGLKNGKSEVLPVPISYESTEQCPLSLGQADEVIYVDYTPPDHIIDRILAAGCRSLLIIDHHKTAADLHAELAASTRTSRRRCRSIFDLAHSGASLTWQHVAPQAETPRPIALLEHYDLGRCWTDPQHPDSLAAKQLVAYLMRALPREPRLWSRVLLDWHAHMRSALDIGARLHAADMQIVRAASRRPHWVNIGGFEVPALNGLPHGLLNDALHELLQEHPDAAFAASWTVLAHADQETVIKWSLRGGGMNRKVPDLGAFCKLMDENGGGHPMAAGFATTDPVLFV